MYNNEITFDKLPQAITYLTEQVAELKKMVLKLQPTQSEKRVLIEIDDASRIIKKAKPNIYTLVRKGLLPYYKKGKKLNFYEDELLAWVENGRKNTSEQNYDQIIVRKKEVYDMDVVIALAYESDNCATHFFRKWLVKKVTSQQKESTAIIIQYGKGFVC